jgi:hypothetical protein
MTKKMRLVLFASTLVAALSACGFGEVPTV